MEELTFPIGRGNKSVESLKFIDALWLDGNFFSGRKKREIKSRLIVIDRSSAIIFYKTILYICIVNIRECFKLENEFWRMMEDDSFIK